MNPEWVTACAHVNLASIQGEKMFWEAGTESNLPSDLQSSTPSEFEFDLLELIQRLCAFRDFV